MDMSTRMKDTSSDFLSNVVGRVVFRIGPITISAYEVSLMITYNVSCNFILTLYTLNLSGGVHFCYV
jgi:hypothetical protein